MKKINVVIAGIGHDHAHDAFECITKIDSSFNLIGLVIEQDDNGNYERYKEQYGVYKHYEIDEVKTIKNLDAVIVECDDKYLTEYATKFASLRLPVHMDKPGSQNKEEFDKLIKICKENNIVLHLGYMYRYNPSIKKAIEICKSGLIGKIYSIETDMSGGLSFEKRKWLSSFKGGMMNYLGCHLIDVVITLLGKPESVIPYNTKSLPEVGEDQGLAILKYDNVLATIKSSAVELDGFSRRHIVINAEKMTIEICPIEKINDKTKLISTSIYKSPVIIPNVPIGVENYGPVDRYEMMFEEFASIVRKEINSPYTLEHEQLIHDVLLAACGDFGKEIKL